jgi:hypothetical protein
MLYKEISANQNSSVDFSRSEIILVNLGQWVDVKFEDFIGGGDLMIIHKVSLLVMIRLNGKTFLWFVSETLTLAIMITI